MKRNICAIITVCLFFTGCSLIGFDDQNANDTDVTISALDTINISPNTMLRLHSRVNYDEYVSLMQTDFPDQEIESKESFTDIDFPDIECCGVRNPQWIIDEMKSISSFQYGLSSAMYVDLHLEVSSINFNNADYLLFNLKFSFVDSDVTFLESSSYYSCSGNLISADASLCEDLSRQNKESIWKLIIQVRE